MGQEEFVIAISVAKGLGYLEPVHLSILEARLPHQLNFSHEGRVVSLFHL